MMKSIKKKKGFTLIELIIVIAIIGILAAIAVPKFSGIQNDAKAKSDIASAKAIADAAATLYAQGSITSLTEAAATTTNITNIQSVPKVQAKYTDITGTPTFYVEVTSDGVVTVTVKGTTGEEILYPAPAN